jgi:dTDP-4-amino-4,6-dideoxygalactose transaminase
MSVQTLRALTRVPFLDLAPIHEGLKDELLADFAALIDSGAFINGSQVETFERAFAASCGVPDCIGLASGLDALRLALLAADAEPGDEVIVPAMTFAATIEAVLQAGFLPRLVDVSEVDYCLDPEAAEAATRERTRVLMPVHLYGQLADVRALTALAERSGALLIEDACQAHGAERDGIVSGGAGTAAAFSFYPGKNLGAFGDAGALVTGDPELARRVRALREHGQASKYRHELVGYTARLDTLQALVLLRKLPLLAAWNEERRAAAAFYAEGLEGVGDLLLPPVAPGSNPVWHLYVIRTGRREALAAFLQARGISTGRHYPQPLHLTDAYRGLGYTEGAFPVAEALAEEGLSLPMFPGITDAQLGAVAGSIRDFFDGVW